MKTIKIDIEDLRQLIECYDSVAKSRKKGVVSDTIEIDNCNDEDGQFCAFVMDGKDRTELLSFFKR